MAEQGFEFYSNNYTSGPGINAPSKVFGPGDVASMTNARLDEFVKQQQKQKQLNQARLQKMLSDLKVSPKGMYSKDLPDFVKGKAELEKFYTESIQNGVDPNNPRYLEQYQKAMAAKDRLDAMQVASSNTNKVLIDNQKRFEEHPEKWDADKYYKDAYNFGNAPLSERISMSTNLLTPKVFDEVNFIDKEIKPLVKKETPTEIIGAEKRAINYGRLDELTGKKENEGLSKDESTELKKIQGDVQYNKDVLPGYTQVKQLSTYGPRVEFDVPNAKGGQTEFASLPSQMIGLGRTALGNSDWSKKIHSELDNYRNGKDAFGNVPMKVVNGQNVPDEQAMDLNREQYQNMVLAAESFSKDGVHIDAVELASALRLNESFKLDESMEGAASNIKSLQPTPYTREYARWINSKAGMEAVAQEGATDYLARRMQQLFTGADSEYKEVNGKRVPIHLIFDKRGLGAEINDGMNKKSPNSMIDGYFEDGSLYIKTMSSAKNVNPEIQKEVDAIQLKINQLKDDPSKRTGKGRWIDAKAELEYNQLKKQLDDKIDAGGYTYVRYGGKDGIKFMLDYIKANYPPNQVANMQNQFIKSAEKLGLYDSKTGNSVIKQQNTQAVKTEKASTGKKVTSDKLKSLVGTKGFEGYTYQELVDYYKGQGYTIK